MAFDGITICSLVAEFQNKIENGRIQKIAQPENDALMLTIKGNDGNKKLFISASASLPLLYFTEETKQNPMVAPNFCMLLRKHLSSARITKIYQPDFERIVVFELEHRNELGDLCSKKLIVEIMGKHSNIIFTDDQDVILDSIKHIPASVSSVREVLPGRNYFIPKTTEKINPLAVSKEEFFTQVYSKPLTVLKALYQTFTGLSPVAASEICTRANLEADRPTEALSDIEKEHLYRTFSLFMEDVQEGRFTPALYYEGKEPKEYAVFPYRQYADYREVVFSSISDALTSFYAEKECYTRIRQKSSDLRRVVTTALERNRKKLDLQEKQYRDTDKMDTFRIYGELLHTYGYEAQPEAKKLTCLNYYTNEEITIPLDETMTAMDNAKRYFDKYGKMKRTRQALDTLLVETRAEIEHLETVLTALDIAVREDDLSQIREELMESGYIRKRPADKKKVKIKSAPFHYRSSDGFDIYVGKNNLQNEEITFNLADGGDWWFHAKKIPGSHVVVKTKGQELPDGTFEEAARLAAFYSKAKGAGKVEIDYVKRKEVKKPGGSKPGFVVYYTNYSMTIEPDITGIELVSD
ncbi:MAG: fibronectin/fibrinogen-binding protein [Lachnospiraceae bacterium]|nr:fibronectin/fibrinogen-binding protein [Lachnospiraceae bacterium]